MTAVDAPRTRQYGLSVLRRPACTIARLRGDLDIAATSALREQQAGMLGPGVRLLIIDLSGVSFCGAARLAMLIGTQRRTRTRGITVRLAVPRPRPRSCCASPTWTAA